MVTVTVAAAVLRVRPNRHLWFKFDNLKMSDELESAQGLSIFENAHIQNSPYQVTGKFSSPRTHFAPAARGRRCRTVTARATDPNPFQEIRCHVEVVKFSTCGNSQTMDFDCLFFVLDGN